MSGYIDRLKAQVSGKGKYEFRLVIMSQGVNSHHTIRKDSLEFDHEMGGNDYKVEPTTLYIWRPPLGRRILWRLRGIKRGFMAIYREGQSQAIGFKAPEVTPGLIKVIYSSGALTKALKDEFKEGMDVKRLFMIFMVIAVILVLYLALTGQLKIGV